MKTAFVADVHVGNPKRFGGPVTASINERCRMTLDVLQNAVGTAIAQHCARFVVAGDLLDYSRPEAPVLSAVQQIFRGASKAGMEIILLVGNHEQISLAPHDHALGVLSTYAVVVTKAMVLSEGLICVPFQPGKASDWLPSALRETVSKAEGAGVLKPKGSGRRALALHLGVRDAKTAPWLQQSPDAIDASILLSLCDAFGISQVIAGNWHDHRVWEDPRANIMQLGALVPTGWDNPGLSGYGTLGIIEDDPAFQAATRIELEGPRFLSAKGLEAAGKLVNQAFKKRPRGAPNKLFVSVEVSPEDMPAANKWLQDERDAGRVHAGEVLPDSTVAKSEAQNAAAAARNPKNRDAALASYIAHKPMPEHIDRNRILLRAQGYLKVNA